MNRLRSAVHEWLELRTRVREERSFHLDHAAADLRALGLDARQARRMARRRFGNSQAGLRELGGDARGLAHLLRAYRVEASLCLQPVLLLTAIAVMLAMSPSPGELLEGMLGHRFHSVPSQVALEIEGAGPASPGIELREIDAVQSMRTIADAASSGPHQILARPMPGATLAAIASEARSKTGNLAFYAMWIEPQPKVNTSPAKVIWGLLAIYGCFFLRRSSPRWLARALSTGLLHATASITLWALATQFWAAIAWRTPTAAGLSFSLLAVVFLLVVAAQCRYWRRDLRRRCPICLDRLLLSWTQGERASVLLNAELTESVCANGHGALSESRWARRYTLSCAP